MDSFSKILDQEIGRLGAASVTYQSVLSALFVVALTFGAIIVARVLVTRAQTRLSEERKGALFIVGQLARYVIVFVGVVATGSALGVNLSSFSLFAGALGVGVGLGLQDVIKNFVCGLILMFDRSIEVGDYIELDDGTIGEVVGIGSRATTILTNDNVDVLQPNSVLLSGKLTNWTRNRQTRRVHIPFAVAYGSDKEKVRTAILEAAAAVPFTLPDDGLRRTQVWLTSFGDSALNFELIVWPTLAAVKRFGSMKAAYCWAIDDALRVHGIEIPFPQRDIRVRSFFGREEDNAIGAFHGEASTAVKTPRRSKTASVNDAADEIAESDTDPSAPNEAQT